MDVGAVYAYADGFARALLTEDEEVSGNLLPSAQEPSAIEVVASYLGEELRGSLAGLLETLPQPIEAAEVLTVIPALESGECVSVTRFAGRDEDVLLRAVWIERENEVLMQSAQVVARRVH